MNNEDDENNSGFGIVGLVIFIIFGYFIYQYFFKYPYRYIGYFYPTINNMEKWVESKPMSSLNECQNWVNSMIDKYHVADGNYDYECRKDCYKADPYNQGVTYTCKTSVQ